MKSQIIYLFSLAALAALAPGSESSSTKLLSGGICASLQAKRKISKARDRGIHKKTLKILLPRNHRGR